MFFYVVSRTYAEIFSLLRICSGLLSNSPGVHITKNPNFFPISIPTFLMEMRESYIRIKVRILCNMHPWTIIDLTYFIHS